MSMQSLSLFCLTVCAYHPYFIFFFFFSSRRRHTRCLSDWSSDVCADDLLDLVLDGRHAGHAADEDDVVDLVRGQACVLEHPPGRADGALQQVVRELVQLRPGELEVEVLRALRGGGDERKVDLRRHR